MARIEFVPVPPTSFPYRDLLVLEHLPLEPTHQVCEIGIGSGETAARLARMCAKVTGFEISGPTVSALGYLEQRHPNLNLVTADITDGSALAPFRDRFDRALSCDTLEHVADPAAFFRGVADLLAPRGEFIVTFPNEPAASMHGITRFDTPGELAGHLQRAGLDVRMGAAKLTPHAEKVALALGWKPLRLARESIAVSRALWALREARLASKREAPPKQPPQTFDETRFFRLLRLWRPLAPAVNLYWYAVLRLMTARGPSFHIDWDFRETPFHSCQVFLAGHKRSGGAPG